MSTKLTKWTREEIARAAVAHAFNPRQEALAQAEDQLAREAYASLFTAEELALVSAVPENWFRPDQCLRFNVGGLTITLSVLGSGLPVPYRLKGEAYGGYGCHLLGVIPHGDLCDRIQKHAHAVEDCKVQRRQALSATEAMLNAVTTIGKLREVWPQGEAFFSKYENVPVPSLPAVRVDEVNALLGLAA